MDNIDPFDGSAIGKGLTNIKGFVTRVCNSSITHRGHWCLNDSEDDFYKNYIKSKRPKG